jgi:ABC-type antimicrobial peptide transport system permease subunit
MELRSFLIGIVLFSFIITGVAIMMAEESKYYNVNLSAGWNESYSKLSPMKSEAQNYKGEVTAQEEEGTTVSSGLTRLIKAAGSVILLPWKAFEFVFGSEGPVEQFQKDYNIPTWIIDAFFTIVIIVIVFAIISAVLRWRT